MLYRYINNWRSMNPGEIKVYILTLMIIRGLIEESIVHLINSRD